MSKSNGGVVIFIEWLYASKCDKSVTNLFHFFEPQEKWQLLLLDEDPVGGVGGVGNSSSEKKADAKTKGRRKASLEDYKNNNHGLNKCGEGDDDGWVPKLSLPKQ